MFELSMKQGIHNATQILRKVHMDFIPKEIVQLNDILAEEELNLVKVTHLLSENPIVMGSFLGFANKILNRPKSDLIFDIHAAVSLLGIDEIKNIYISSYLNHYLQTKALNPKIIKHDMRCGIVAADLSYHIYSLSRSEAYLYSFSQNIGLVYMLDYDEEHYIDHYLNASYDRPIEAHKREFAYYQTSHAFIGAVVSKRWHLSDALYKFILFHHESDLTKLSAYDETTAKAVAINHIANYLVLEHCSDHLMTSELKNLFTQSVEFLNCSESMINSAIGALKKWGDNSVGLTTASH